MTRRIALAALGLFLSVALPALADATRLTAQQIEALLSGQRIAGDWNGTAYSQVFWEGGTTLYLPQGGPSDAGKWRVNPAEGTYESWWENSGWSSYAIERKDGALYWVDGSGARHPFEVTGDR